MINRQQTLLLTFTGNGTRDLTRSVELQLRTEGHSCGSVTHLASIVPPMSITEQSFLVCIQGTSTTLKGGAKSNETGFFKVRQWLAFGGRVLIINLPTSDPRISRAAIASEAERLTVLSLQNPEDVAQAISFWVESAPEPLATASASSNVIPQSAGVEKQTIPTALERPVEKSAPTVEKAAPPPGPETLEKEPLKPATTRATSEPPSLSARPSTAGRKGRRRRSHGNSAKYGSDAAAMDSFQRVAYGQGRTFPIGCLFAALTFLISIGLVILAIINF